jgi:hypothetical protein
MKYSSDAPDRTHRRAQVQFHSDLVEPQFNLDDASGDDGILIACSFSVLSQGYLDITDRRKRLNLRITAGHHAFIQNTFLDLFACSNSTASWGSGLTALAHIKINPNDYLV